MGTIWFLRRAQYARREDECLMNVRSGSYGSHRGSRRTHYARRRDAVSYKRALCVV